MSSRSSNQSVSAVLEAVDQTPDSTAEVAMQLEEATATEPAIVDIQADGELGVGEAQRVVGAFTELASAWEQRASVFLDEHPDIQLLLAERKAQEEQVRQAEVLAARDRRLRALVAECQEATRTGLLHDGRRLV